MKKVLFVATGTMHIKGFHSPYLRYFKEQGYEVHVASRNKRKNDYIEFCDMHYDIPFERFPIKKNNIVAYKELKKIISENDYDIIHCHTPVGGALTRLAAKKARKDKNTKVFYTAHGFHFYKGAPLLNWILYYPIEKWLSRYTDVLITINKEDYDLAKKKFKKCDEIYYVHGVGVDEKKFNIEMTDEEKIALKKSLNLEDDDFVLLYSARLDKNKNHSMIIDAMQDVVLEYPKIHLIIAGKDERNGFYQNLVREKHLNNNIHFFERRDDIPKILKVIDLGVSTSIREGLGLNIIEENLCNLPVIATNNRGHKEVIENGVNGYLVEIGDSTALSKYIKEMYINKEKYNSISQNCKSKIQKFCLRNVLNEMIKIYNIEKLGE